MRSPVAAIRTWFSVHELGGALESWNDVLPALEKEFRVLRYDQRGFGLSEKSKGTLNINDMTGDTAALTAAVGMNGPCCVVGTAMGAGIAMAYSMHYPERVARQVLTSPATGTTADRAQQYQDRAKLVEENGMRASVDASLDRSYPEIFRKDPAKFARLPRALACQRSLWFRLDQSHVGLDQPEPGRR